MRSNIKHLKLTANMLVYFEIGRCNLLDINYKTKINILVNHRLSIGIEIAFCLSSVAFILLFHTSSFRNQYPFERSFVQKLLLLIVVLRITYMFESNLVKQICIQLVRSIDIVRNYFCLSVVEIISNNITTLLGSQKSK